MQQKPRRSVVEQPELIRDAEPTKERGLRRGAFAGGAILTAIGLAALAVLPSSMEGAAQFADPLPAVSSTPERVEPVTRANIRTEVEQTPTPEATPSQTPSAAASSEPAKKPSKAPTAKPSKVASAKPSAAAPSRVAAPSTPAAKPSEAPSTKAATPSPKATSAPASPSPKPTKTVEPKPTVEPTPTTEPTPSVEPSPTPTRASKVKAKRVVEETPSVKPTPERTPTVKPSPTPTREAKVTPSNEPSKKETPVPALGKVVGEMQATAPANVRKGPGTEFDAITSVREGDKVSITDVKRDGWQQVKIDDKAGFISSKLLGAVVTPKPTPPAKPTPTPTPTKDSPATKPEVPALPKLGDSAGERWATTAVNVRKGPGTSHKVVAALKSGEKVRITDVKIDGWQQINRDGKAAYVSAKFLSDKAPSSNPSKPDVGDDSSKAPSGECSNASAQRIASGLTSRTRNVLWATCSQFPSIKTYLGNRPGSGSFHNSGRALDVMVSGDFGWQVARWARANASELGISEVIYAQRIWTTQRSSEGWRYMSDRGSVSANHYDHVHISVR